MGTRRGSILLTGATGLLGGEVLSRLLLADAKLEALVLVRDEAGWRATATRRGVPLERVEPVRGDITQPGLGLDATTRARLAREIRAVVHLAADTTFSQTLRAARATNVEGTRHLLELADECYGVERFAFASTAFVAGRRIGLIHERACDGGAGWVNAYEQSKHEAERLVRSSDRDWVIFRPSTVVCDEAGAVHQINAVHRALRLYHHGLASMMPGAQDSPMDMVTSDYVGAAMTALALHDDSARKTFHLCAGAGALPLGELLDHTYGIWSAVPAWKRRAIPRPALCDLDTYRLFERTVEETGDEHLKRIARSLSYFVPQLAYPKRFDTTCADAALGFAAPVVSSFWPRMVEHLLATGWGNGRTPCTAFAS